MCCTPTEPKPHIRPCIIQYIKHSWPVLVQYDNAFCTFRFDMHKISNIRRNAGILTRCLCLHKHLQEKIVFACEMELVLELRCFTSDVWDVLCKWR